jgi:ankyrin repeat protein
MPNSVYGMCEPVKLLMQHATANYRCIQAETPLLCAVRGGSSSLVEYLLNAGASINECDEVRCVLQTDSSMRCLILPIVLVWLVGVKFGLQIS